MEPAALVGSKRKHQDAAALEQELFECVKRGNFGRVRELVKIERVSVNCATTHYGHAPLTLAVIWERARVARFLLDNGASVDATNINGNTALAYAVDMGNVSVAELLLEYGADVEVEAHMFGKNSLLPCAIRKRNVGMVRLLLRFGANTEETIYGGKTYTALYIASDDDENNRTGSTMEILQLLLDHNDVDVNRITKPWLGPAMSPLCAACKRNDLQVAQLLIQNGAQVIYNGVYPDRPCPLQQAVEFGSLELVQLLLDNRPIAPREHEVETHPLSLPLENALANTKLEAAQLLVDAGTNVNDEPFLWQCAQAGRNESARFLLRNGADVNQVDNDTGETPLWVAAKSGPVDLVKEFLKAGADASICDNAGEKPLEVARRKGHKGVVYLLLRTSPSVWSRLRAVWKGS